MKGFSDMRVEQIEVEIISDLACPWCYLGQRRLQLALDAVADVVQADVSWKPYQLEPDVPAGGFETRDYLDRKLGGADAVQRAFEMLTNLAAEIDLPIAMDKATVFPNTLDGHRLIYWAGLIGSDMQDRIARALLQANFVDGADVGRADTLLRIASENGMDRKAIEQKLASDIDRDVVRAEIERARNKGVSGVPCFIIDGKYAITGAQSVDVFANAFRQIAEMKRMAAEETKTHSS
jgi:predicted DsbA family dithiol-disulfide isomerase